MDLKKYIRSIQDYPKKGILFRDITTLIKDPKAFNFAIDKIVEISKKIKFDKVSAIESRGFIFASALSYLTNKPLILLRKIHKDSIDRGDRVLVIDDLIATGGTAEAAGN